LICDPPVAAAASRSVLSELTQALPFQNCGYFGVGVADGVAVASGVGVAVASRVAVADGLGCILPAVLLSVATSSPASFSN
jgi:hypothetical protein